MTRNNSDWTYDDLREAEVVPAHSGEGSYLVRLGENDYVSVPNTGLTTLALHDDVFDSFDGDGTAFDDDSAESGSVTVDVDFDANEVVLERGGDTARIPSEFHENVFYAVHDRDMARLNDLFEEHYTPTVREGVMDWFLPRFRSDDEVRKTDEGWLIDGQILVRWDATNELATSTDTHVVRGGSTQKKDVGRTALDIDYQLPEEKTATTPDGRSVDLSEEELRFLTTVGLELRRGGLGDLYDDAVSEAIDSSNITSFTDPKSGIHHGHSKWNKANHHITDLDVTEQAADMLWSNPNDHSACHEMMIRRQEFENSPIDVFENAPNDDPSRWRSISSAQDKAPIPQEFKEQLQEMYD